MAKKTEKTLDQALEHINSEFGSGSIFRLAEAPTFGIECMPTGILPLDLALGDRGGLPRGRITEIYGPLASGKTTILLTAIAEAQKRDETCAFIDAEHALDLDYAKALGVKVDDLLISQPMYGEEAFSIMEALAETETISIIGVDSVAALLPRGMIDGSYGDAFVGMHPKFMSQSLGKLVRVASGGDTAIVFINQLRENIGKTYGPSEYTPGGKALGYYSSVRLDVRRIATLKDSEDEAIANRTKVKVVKSKVGRPYQSCEFDIEYGVGVPRENCLVDLGVQYGLIVKKGAWFASADGENLGQGKAKATAHLVATPELADELERRIKEIASDS